MELVFLGLFVGILSGFFGIGGGTIVVPLLLMFGFDMKDVIGISITQMIFSSIYGSYLNSKKGSLDINLVSTIAFGGFIGAIFSPLITKNLSNFTLEIIFLFFALFALLRMFFKTKEDLKNSKVNKKLLFFIGFILGIICISIGVGGSIILVPLLVGFFHIELKKAISAGLFFVIFSSMSGFISHSIVGDIDYKSGIIMGLASLVGVYFGIELKDKINIVIQRKLLIIFYFIIVVYLMKRILF